jgi:phosphoadenosine phosphosulfate reductase
LKHLQYMKEQARALEGAPCAMFFSGGKDAIASGHLLRLYHRGPIYWIYLYFVDGLSFVESTLRTYERMWGISILRRPSDEHLSLTAQMEGKKKTRYTYADTERLYSAEVGAEWTCAGMKRADSFARRGMLSGIEDGIDWKGKKIYPVIDWSEKKVEVYCRLNKLPLPPTYACGFKRSIWIPDAETMIWIKSAYPDDYEKIISTFPSVGDAVFKRFGSV